ncbi:MAG: pyridoxine 5'-phosphate synthase, partial [Longimicrobiales bacterium]
ASDVLAIALELKPMAATLVPERREEITTEGGLELQDPGVRVRVEHAVQALQDAGIRVALFISPDIADIDASADLGADAIELHTGEFAGAFPRRHARDEAYRLRAQIDRLADAACHARTRSLAVHAGHGLTYENVHAVAALRDIEELNIGHSVVSRAVLVGMERAVREMADRVRAARHASAAKGA